MSAQSRQRYSTAHEGMCLNLGRVLQMDHSSDDIWVNSKYRHGRRCVPGTNIFPDVINFTRHISYEVHWAGNRKESAFDRLPQGWRGVNVFITDIWQTEELYVLALDDRFCQITESDWISVPR